MADAAKTHQPLNPLLADNIIEHTRIYQRAESAINEYFRSYSKLFRAIHKHIGNPNAECYIIDLPQHCRIMRYSECGAAVHFKDLTVWGTQWKWDEATKRNVPYEVDHFGLDITVEYHDEEEDRSVTRQYTINVPIDLEVNFTQEKFDAWISELAQKRKTEREAADKEALESLLKKHPTWREKLNQDH
jgi:hypothetical protein